MMADSMDAEGEAEREAREGPEEPECRHGRRRRGLVAHARGESVIGGR